MDPAHKALLRGHRLELSGQLLVSDTIVPFLYQEDILTETQVEDIVSQPTNRQKSLKLLDILPSRGPRAFDSFLSSLEEFSWVRDKLLLELQTRPGPSSTGIWRLPDSVLQKVPSDRELSRLAARLGGEWEAVLMDLGLSAEALFRCRSDHSLSTHGAVLAGLVQWRRSDGKKATVQRLLQSLEAAGVHPSVLEDVLM
ncbi:death domain-containing protein CRADD [Enoplosus armatus]|uniref:death domain-containing protein CRADD n=1 Tax=Enoplosus armatus TaxID=215367 RepID=UPI0039969B38